MNIAIYCVIAVLITIVGALLGMALTLYAVRPIIIDYRRSLNKRDIEVLNYPKASEHKDSDDDQAVVQYNQAEDYGRISLDKKLKIKFIVGDRLLKMQVLEFSGLYSFQPGGFIRQGFASYLGKDIVAIGAPGGVETTRYFESTAARKEYLANIVTSITNELFTRKGKPLPWEECEFRDNDTDEWIRATYVGTLQEKGEMIGVHMAYVSPLEVQFWQQVRPLTISVLPTAKTNGSEIIYTWEEK